LADFTAKTVKMPDLSFDFIR